MWLWWGVVEKELVGGTLDDRLILGNRSRSRKRI